MNRSLFAPDLPVSVNVPTRVIRVQCDFPAFAGRRGHARSAHAAPGLLLGEGERDGARAVQHELERVANRTALAAAGSGAPDAARFAKRAVRYDLWREKTR